MNLNGADDRSRTGDLLITNQLLYQLSYVGELLRDSTRMGGGRKADSANTLHTLARISMVRAPKTKRAAQQGQLFPQGE